MTDLYEQLQESIRYIRSRSSDRPKVGVILGTGWQEFTKQLSPSTTIRYRDIPHLLPQHRKKENGALITGKLGEMPLACLNERFHLYQGLSARDVAHPVRVLCHLGIKTLFVTNAAGGIKRGFKKGDLMLITDHINMTMQSPATGVEDDRIGDQFTDMTRAYDPVLIKMATNAAKALRMKVKKGVYLGVCGPSFETPAEIAMFGKMGADAVGMSTVTDVIAARQMGVRVCGLSCITNKAAGLGPQKLTEEEVHVVMNEVQTGAFQLLREMIISSTDVFD
ncbi:MAG: purine-nucleoside phosphorylase [Candidatus Brocadiales bacterium]|nr:purine-nucleoside phosphorylase [Candidatus Bathyanammoxibius amoris]